MEFNALLRGSRDTSYNVISGNIQNLQSIKYIITLDADTALPRDSAKKLVGAMSHILNKPYIDKESKKVIRGHGLMQPRISVGTVSANKTLFSRIFREKQELICIQVLFLIYMKTFLMREYLQAKVYMM